MFIYVAGPLTQGVAWLNVKNAMDATHKLMDLGCMDSLLDPHTDLPIVRS